MGLQEAMATEMPQDSGTDRVLEELQELVGEGGGFVEAEAGFWMGGTRIRISLDLFEEPIDHAQVVMEMRIKARAEAVQEADRAHGGGPWGRGGGFSQAAPESAEQDVKDGAGRAGAVMKEGPEALGHGEDELADGHVGNDVVHQVGCGLGHALGPARGTASPALAGERHEEVVAAGCASSPGKAVGQDAAPEIAPEFLFHVIGDAVAKGLCFIGQGEVGLQVLPDDTVQGGSFGAAPAIGLGMGAGRWPGWWCGPPRPSVSGAGLCGHRWSPASRGARRSYSTSRRAEGWGRGMEGEAGVARAHVA
jgi:hypothetical protein